MEVFKPEEDGSMITDNYFNFVLRRMPRKLGKSMAEAARLVLVEGLSVNEVVERTNVKQSHLSSTLTKIRQRAKELDSELNLKAVPMIRLPAQLVAGALEQEKYSLENAEKDMSRRRKRKDE